MIYKDLNKIKTSPDLNMCLGNPSPLGYKYDWTGTHRRLNCGNSISCLSAPPLFLNMYVSLISGKGKVCVCVCVCVWGGGVVW